MDPTEVDRQLDLTTETASEVKCLLDLPNEVLIYIFEYLLPSDRRVASECCKRFLEIWLLDKFIDDRRLNFREIILDPELEPCSIFLKSQRNYKHLVLSHVTFHDGLDKLWEQLGKTVTTIEFSWSDWLDKKFWEMFPKLEILLLKGYFTSEQYNVVFPLLPQSLQHISILVSGIEDVVIALDQNCHKFRSSAINFVCDGTALDVKAIQKYVPTYQQSFRKLVLWNMRRDNDYLTCSLNLHLQHLKHLHYLINHQQELDNLEERFPELEYLKLELTVNNVLPYKNWPYLKSLVVIGPSKKELLRLKTFENLEVLHLKLWHDTRECFFVHEPYVNRSLKTMKIESSFEMISCLTCFKTMTETFSNLETFENNLITTNAYLKLLAENSPKLRNLVLNNCLSDERLSFENLPKLSSLHLYRMSLNVEPDLETWPLMPHLRELSIDFVHLDHSNVKMFEKVPALEDLRFHCNSIDEDAHGLILALVKPLKRLRRLSFSSKAKIYSAKATLFAIMNNCQYLREIYLLFSNGVNFDKNYLKNLFKEHSSIRRFGYYSNIFHFRDFQEIREKNTSGTT